MGNEACSSLNSETLPVILSIMLLSNRDKSERDIHCMDFETLREIFQHATIVNHESLIQQNSFRGDPMFVSTA